ncbi:MAG: class I SAM-dependent methyltransferase [Candidatus Pacebacteria bacterium]|nr:class I SAM-dependent methyltransferase [Candidatus Paceibacterota bacterium]
MNKNDSQKIIEKVKDDYDLIAKEWDLSRNRVSGLKKTLMVDIKDGDKVLDLGCGNALMLSSVLEKSVFYVGLDISGKMIEIVKEKYKKEIEQGNVSFFVGQVTELSFQDEEFDFVMSFAVLHHIPSKELQGKYFQEVKRICKRNAKVKISVWNLLSEWPNNRFHIEDQLAGEKSGATIVPWKATSGKIVDRYIYQFSEEDLFFLAEKAGFRNIKIYYSNRGGERKENAEELVLEMEK